MAVITLLHSSIQSSVELREALRLQTKALHHQLDQHPLLSQLMARKLALEDYIHCLQALYLFLVPQEREIERFMFMHPISASYQYRRKVTSLRKDLSYLRQNIEVDFSAPCLAIESIADLVGVLYCVEGSMLGGQFIVRQLQRSLPEVKNAMNYFFGYGEKTHQYWSEFWSFAGKVCVSSCGREQAVSAACRYFEGLKTHLDEFSLSKKTEELLMIDTL